MQTPTKSETLSNIQATLPSSAAHHGWCRPSSGGVAKHGFYVSWRGDTRFLGASAESALAAAESLAQDGLFQ